MSNKNQLLTKSQFDELLKSDKWKIEEIDPTIIKATPLIQRKHQILGAFASGDANATRPLNGHQAVLGMDVLVYEERPWRNKGEEDVNVYHYIITQTFRVDFPYRIQGPYRTEALVDHWPSGLPLGPYQN